MAARIVVAGPRCGARDGELDGSGRVVRRSLGSSVVERLGYAVALAAAAYRK